MFATELVSCRADLRAIEKVLGVATTEIYTHKSTARQRETMQLLERPIGPGQVTGITTCR